MREAEYDWFAEEFSKTRNVPWKEVIEFLENLPKNSADLRTRRHGDLKAANNALRRPEDIKILDIGCGNGRHLLAAKKEGLIPVGIDISKNLLKIAKRKVGVPLVLGDALALPFKDRAFDNTICVAVIHHFRQEDEREKCMEEIARVTQKTSIISVWAFEQEKFAKRKTQDIQLGWNKEHPRFYHLFREGELENLAQNAGVKVSKSFRSGNNYWVVIDCDN